MKYRQIPLRDGGIEMNMENIVGRSIPYQSRLYARSIGLIPTYDNMHQHI